MGPRNGSNNRRPATRSGPAYVVVDERKNPIPFTTPDPTKPWCVTLARRFCSRHKSQQAALDKINRIRRGE